MLSFIARRLGLLIPTFFGVTLLTFALIRLIPGDPVEVMMGERRVDPQMHAEALHRLGLDKPLYQQYLDYVGNLAQGNLGKSIRTHEPVWNEFLTLFSATLELSFAAMLFAGTLGLLAGVVAALKRGSIFDHGVMTISLAGYSMPIFWWGLLLIMLFSVSLGWTPVSDRIGVLYEVEPKTGFMLIDTLLSDEEGAFLDAVRHLILPAIVLGSILYQSGSLALIYGGESKTAFFVAKLASRSVQFAVTGVLDVLLVWALCRSRVFTAAGVWPSGATPAEKGASEQ